MQSFTIQKIAINQHLPPQEMQPVRRTPCIRQLTSPSTTVKLDMGQFTNQKHMIEGQKVLIDGF